MLISSTAKSRPLCSSGKNGNITHPTIISSNLNRWMMTGKCVIRSYDLCVKQKLATLLWNSLMLCWVQIQRVIEKGYLGAWWSLVGVFALQLDLHKFLSKKDESCTINLCNGGAKNSHKEQSYLASRSQQHRRWYVGFSTRRFAWEGGALGVGWWEKEGERLWPIEHLDSGASGEKAVLSELFRGHITAP